ncbi:DUF488 domain-containing protein [Candidatus Woesearchaeota archaeon]|nr:DUF488 domain-containing protein [Candidatus Woesearchaeota archaeon]
MLYTKCIFHNVENSDGTRISVMSRHTLNDGITPDPRITAATFEEWIPELAPPLKLVGDYYHRNLAWADFERRYLEHLSQTDVSSLVSTLAKRSLSNDITLLCVEETPECCHRRLLAEECQKYEPTLSIEHR